MFASSQLAQRTMCRVQEELSSTTSAQGELVSEGTLLYCITFTDNPVTVGLHEIVRDRLYAVTIFDGQTGNLILNDVWMLGQETASESFDFCPVRRERTSSFHCCNDCSKAKRAWLIIRPGEDDALSEVVGRIVHEVAFALTLR